MTDGCMLGKWECLSQCPQRLEEQTDLNSLYLAALQITYSKEEFSHSISQIDHINI